MENFNHPFRHPKNAEGPFYTIGSSGLCDGDYATAIWYAPCLECGLPESEAPELFAPLDDNNSDTYLVRQPATPEETARAIGAVNLCCVAAVRYGGQDRSVIAALGNNCDVCDFVVDDEDVLRCAIAADGQPLPFAVVIRARRRETPISPRVHAEFQRQLQERNRKWRVLKILGVILLAVAVILAIAAIAAIAATAVN